MCFIATLTHAAEITAAARRCRSARDGDA